jgi:hypothetical protein
MTQDLLPRAADIFRHLSDLRSGTYEGARQWPERVEVFRRAVSLLDPVVRRILDQANATGRPARGVTVAAGVHDRGR